MEIQEVAEPAPKPNQLVVDVAYAGVVFPDVLQMPGEYQLRPELPFTPGWEVSGVVRVDAGGFRPSMSPSRPAVISTSANPRV